MTAENDAARRCLVQVDLVDLGIEPVIVRAQRPQHTPHGREPFIVVEGGSRVDARGHRDRQHDIAVRLALGLAHGTADGLHDVHLAVAWTHEQHGVERRHVDPLGQAAGVRQDPAGTHGITLQPFDARLPFERMMLAVDVLSLTPKRRSLLCLRQARDGLLDDVIPVAPPAALTT